MDIEKIDTRRFPLKHEVFRQKEEIGERLSALRAASRAEEAAAAERHLRRRRRNLFVGLSAGAVCAAAIAFAIFLLRVVVVGAGAVPVSVTLPCGSAVNVAAGSEISYRPNLWSIAGRRVELDGTAHFLVKKGVGTFVVSTEYGRVTVCGTEFEVSENSGKMTVTCFEGSVKVSAGSNNASVMLHAGETAEAGKECVSQPAPMQSADEDDSDNVPEVVNYNRAKLTDVVAEIEHCFGVTVENKWMCDGVTYTGAFYPKDMDMTLEIVFRSCGFDYSLKGGNTVVLRRTEQ